MSELSLAQRIRSLVYYGTSDEGVELFEQTCRLCYMMNGLGTKEQAETCYEWAKEMAEYSRKWCEENDPEGLDDFVKGNFGY